jgi:hypothetical protein
MPVAAQELTQEITTLAEANQAASATGSSWTKMLTALRVDSPQQETNPNQPD